MPEERALGLAERHHCRAAQLTGSPSGEDAPAYQLGLEADSAFRRTDERR
jgi:hypothetical protein